MPLPIQETADGLFFKVLIQPRASKNQVVGLHGDALKIRIAAPPVEGAANKMCIEYLAKTLGVSKSALEIVTGLTGRSKRIRIACTQRGAASEKEKARLRRTLERLSGLL